MHAPIFIVGAMGSGSTLTRLILDSHENIAIGQETSFMRLITAHRWVPYWRFGDQWFGRLELSAGELDVELVRFYSSLFERFARRHGKQRWGEKTPHHVWHMEEMARLFPDAVFVGIVRHPGGSASSLVGRFGFATTQALSHWLRLNRQLVHQGCRLGDRFVLLRYEDLVMHSEETMRELLDWLDEPWSPSVLQHHDVQQAKGAPKLVEGRTLSSDPVDASRVAKWMTRFDTADRALIGTETRDWAAFFGYDVDIPEPVEDLVPDACARRRVVNGVELASRRKTFRHRISFKPPPRPKNEGIFQLPRRQQPPSTGPHENLVRWVADHLPASLRNALGQVRRSGARMVTRIHK